MCNNQCSWDGLCASNQNGVCTAPYLQGECARTVAESHDEYIEDCAQKSISNRDEFVGQINNADGYFLNIYKKPDGGLLFELNYFDDKVGTVFLNETDKKALREILRED